MYLCVISSLIWLCLYVLSPPLPDHIDGVGHEYLQKSNMSSQIIWLCAPQNSIKCWHTASFAPSHPTNFHHTPHTLLTPSLLPSPPSIFIPPLPLPSQRAALNHRTKMQGCNARKVVSEVYASFVLHFQCTVSGR